jgi:hypothetical protein
VACRRRRLTAAPPRFLTTTAPSPTGTTPPPPVHAAEGGATAPLRPRASQGHSAWHAGVTKIELNHENKSIQKKSSDHPEKLRIQKT